MSGFLDSDEDDFPQAGPSRSVSNPSGQGSRAFLSRLQSGELGHRSYPGSGHDREGEYRHGRDRSTFSTESAGYAPESLLRDDLDMEGVSAPGDSVFPQSALDPGPEEAELDDVRRLGRVWVRERGTPSVLVWEGQLLDSVLDKLEQQQKMLTTLRSDPATSEEEHFRLVLVQTEMERAKYLVRSYVRTRLHKIEKYAQHITDTPALHSRLSGAELDHARRYAQLLHAHFQHSVLDSLPDWLQRMDDTHGGVSMVATPNVQTPVVIFCRKDCGEITLEDGEIAVLSEGTTHLVRYDLVERWIELGLAEVL